MRVLTTLRWKSVHRLRLGSFRRALLLTKFLTDFNTICPNDLLCSSKLEFENATRRSPISKQNHLSRKPFSVNLLKTWFRAHWEGLIPKSGFKVQNTTLYSEGFIIRVMQIGWMDEARKRSKGILNSSNPIYFGHYPSWPD